MNPSYESGRQSQTSRPFRGDESGDARRPSGRNGDSDYRGFDRMTYGDEPRWQTEGRGSERGDSGRPRSRPDYGAHDPESDRSREGRYGAFGYERREGEGYGGSASSAFRTPREDGEDRSFDERYGRGGREAAYGRGREGNGHDGSEYERGRGRAFTGESYGGSFAGPYAPRNSSSESSGSGGRREWNDYGNGGSSGGGWGASTYSGRTDSGSTWGIGGGSSGRERDENREGRSGSSTTSERESFRGRGPKGYQRADARIQEDLQERLTDDEAIDASEIEVTVKDGEITLGGTVPHRSMKRRAEDLAETISGNKQVQNNIRVKRESREGGDGKQRSASQGSDGSGSGSSTSSTKDRNPNATSGQTGSKH